MGAVQGYLAHKKQPPLLGPLYDPRYSPTVGSQEEGVSYERGISAGAGRAAGGRPQLVAFDARLVGAALRCFKDESHPDEYCSGSMKVATHLDHISHINTASGTNSSNSWTN